MLCCCALQAHVLAEVWRQLVAGPPTALATSEEDDDLCWEAATLGATAALQQQPPQPQPQPQPQQWPPQPQPHEPCKPHQEHPPAATPWVATLWLASAWHALHGTITGAVSTAQAAAAAGLTTAAASLQASVVAGGRAVAQSRVLQLAVVVAAELLAETALTGALGGVAPGLLEALPSRWLLGAGRALEWSAHGAGALLSALLRPSNWGSLGLWVWRLAHSTATAAPLWRPAWAVLQGALRILLAPAALLGSLMLDASLLGEYLALAAVVAVVASVCGCGVCSSRRTATAAAYPGHYPPPAGYPPLPQGYLGYGGGGAPGYGGGGAPGYGGGGAPGYGGGGAPGYGGGGAPGYGGGGAPAFFPFPTAAPQAPTPSQTQTQTQSQAQPGSWIYGMYVAPPGGSAGPQRQRGVNSGWH